MSAVPAELRARYRLGRELGRGTFGKVYQVTHRASGRPAALKLMPQAPTAVQKEVEILRAVSGHARVANLHEAVIEPGVPVPGSGTRGKPNISLVIDLCAGGELFDKIVELQAFQEDDASCLFKKVIKGVLHAHRCGVAHRDLKPENLMLVSAESVTTVKVIDFGLAAFVTPGRMGVPEEVTEVGKDERPFQRVVGTEGYQAPEVVNLQGYGRPGDMWALGVILYIVLCGFPPFDDDERDFEGKLEFPSPEWDHVSADARDLVTRLLAVDPRKRLSAAEACVHPWFEAHQRSHAHESHAHGPDHTPQTAHKHGHHHHGHGGHGKDAGAETEGTSAVAAPATDAGLKAAQDRLREFNAKRRFRNAVMAVQSINRLRHMLDGGGGGGGDGDTASDEATSVAAAAGGDGATGASAAATTTTAASTELEARGNAGVDVHAAAAALDIAVPSTPEAADEAIAAVEAQARAAIHSTSVAPSVSGQSVAAARATGAAAAEAAAVVEAAVDDRPVVASSRCACGSVSLEVRADAADDASAAAALAAVVASECECNICGRNGARHWQVRKRQVLVSGMVDEFTSGDVAYFFCPCCATTLFARRTSDCDHDHDHDDHVAHASGGGGGHHTQHNHHTHDHGRHAAMGSAQAATRTPDQSSPVWINTRALAAPLKGLTVTPAPTTTTAGEGCVIASRS